MVGTELSIVGGYVTDHIMLFSVSTLNFALYFVLIEYIVRRINQWNRHSSGKPVSFWESFCYTTTELIRLYARPIET